MIPRLAELQAAAHAFSLPLSTPFRGVTSRTGLLLRGPSGWGEFAPFLEYSDVQSARWLRAAIEAGWGDWPSPLRDQIPVNAIIPGVAPEAAGELARAAAEAHGCSVFKIKVGAGALVEDCARVAAVRAALPVSQGYRIRVDANAAWSVADAVVAINEIAGAAEGLEYVEQPAGTLDELAQIRARVNVPIAADESIRLADDILAAARTDAVDLVVVKVAPLGGVVPALDVVAAAGVPAVVSGAMDSAVGLGAGIALAAALPELPYAAGLGTGALLAADVTLTPAVPRDGALPVGRISPDPDALAAAGDRVTAEGTRWWQDRLARAYELL